MSRADLPNLTDDEAAAVLAYTPRMATEDWEKVQPVTHAVLLRLDVPNKAWAIRTLRCVAGLAVWCADDDVPLTPERIMDPEVVETWVRTLREGAPESGKGVDEIDAKASRLRAIGPQVTPTLNWPVLREEGRKRQVHEPHPRDHAESLVKAAHRLTKPRQRRIALGVLGLGVGAGCDGGQQHRVRTTDIEIAPDQPDVLLVHVRGTDDDVIRVVPIAKPWDDCVREALEIRVKEFDEFVLPLGRGRNLLNENLRTIAKKSPFLTLSPSRLRTTWMVERLQSGMHVHDFLRLAGLTSAETLMQVARMLPTRDDALVREHAVRDVAPQSEGSASPSDSP